MKVNVKEALQFISSAWDAVTPLTIQNCWEHTGIIPHTDDLMQIPRIDRDPEYQALSREIEKLSFISPMSIQSLIDVDISLETSSHSLMSISAWRHPVTH